MFPETATVGPQETGENLIREIVFDGNYLNVQIVSGDKKQTRDIVIVEFNASVICAAFFLVRGIRGPLVSQLTAQQ